MATRIVSILDEEGLGHELLGNGGTIPNPAATWGVNNKAFFYLFKIRRPMIAKQMWFHNGTTPAGNIDVGLFAGDDRQVGASLALIGGVAQSGAGAIQKFDIADVPLRGGQLVFFGVSLSSSAANYNAIGTASLQIGRSMGIYQQTTAYPLPSTPTPAVLAVNLAVPLISIVGHDT